VEDFILLFDIYYFFKSFTQYNHTFIHPSSFAEASSLLRSAREELLWGAEPRIELGPALQKADASPTAKLHPTELRRTQLSYDALV
jgi:hypothetical protein